MTGRRRRRSIRTWFYSQSLQVRSISLRVWEQRTPSVSMQILIKILQEECLGTESYSTGESKKSIQSIQKSLRITNQSWNMPMKFWMNSIKATFKYLSMDANKRFWFPTTRTLLRKALKMRKNQTLRKQQQDTQRRNQRITTILLRKSLLTIVQ